MNAVIKTWKIIGSLIEIMFCVGGTVVKHSTRDPMMEGSNPATGTGREKNGKKVFYKI
jgi:hypothetical protein